MHDLSQGRLPDYPNMPYLKLITAQKRINLKPIISLVPESTSSFVTLLPLKQVSKMRPFHMSTSTQKICDLTRIQRFSHTPVHKLWRQMYEKPRFAISNNHYRSLNVALQVESEAVKIYHFIISRVTKAGLGHWIRGLHDIFMGSLKKWNLRVQGPSTKGFFNFTYLPKSSQFSKRFCFLKAVHNT